MVPPDVFNKVLHLLRMNRAGLSLADLATKYKMLNGQELPASKHGFSSARDLLSSLSNAVDLCPIGPDPEKDVLVRANRLRIS